MVGLLVLVILISIAFGISLQSAFWGIVSFCIGLAIFFIILGLFGMGIIKLGTAIEKAGSKQAKERRKQAWYNAIFISKLLAIWLCPILIGFIIALILERYKIDFTIQFLVLLGSIIATPFVFKYWWLHRTNKKHAKKN